MSVERKNIMLGTAGHVDHGKTALVKLLTGCDTDRLAEEKHRGLTIELGFAPCRMADDRIVGIVDVPGHVSFIRNMVAGAHGVDVMILVVAADDGVMPQTREHLDVLTLMGARHGLIALTKIDLVDDDTRELAIEELRDLVRGTFLEDAPICPISNVTGAGFDAFFAALSQQVHSCQPPLGRGPFRQWIERSFTAHGHGVVASGIPSAGEVHVNDRLRVLPGDGRARVRRVEVYGDDAEIGRAGECVAMNLSDVDLDDVPRAALLTTSSTLEPVTYCEGRLHLLERMTHPIKHHTEVHLHVGTAHALAKVFLLEANALDPGDQMMVQLRLDHPLPVAPGERFVVRSHVNELGGLTTIGGGRILSASNRRWRRRRPGATEALIMREKAIDDPAAWCTALLIEAGKPRRLAELAAEAHLLPGEVDAIVAQLRTDRTVMDARGGQVVAQRCVAQTADRMTEHLQNHHADHADQMGLPSLSLAQALDIDHNLVRLAAESLIERSVATWHGNLLALVGHQLDLDDHDQQLMETITTAYREANLASPRPAELADTLGEPAKRVARLVQLLADQGELVQLTPEIVMHRDAVATAEQVVGSLFAGTDRFTTAEFRDAAGVSRKYVIPLLDHFDRVRLTVRHGSVRRPGARIGQARQKNR